MIEASGASPLSTAEAVARIVAAQRGPTAYVVGLGRTAGALERATSDPVLALDVMGSVLSVATGLAVGTAGTGIGIVVLDTDGSLMLELGSLAGVAACATELDGLDLYVFDNGLYESGGGSCSRYFDLNWIHLAAGFGLTATLVSSWKELDDWLVSPPGGRVRCVILRVQNDGTPGIPLGPEDGVEKVTRFMNRLLCESGRTRWRRAEKL